MTSRRLWCRISGGFLLFAVIAASFTVFSSPKAAAACANLPTDKGRVHSTVSVSSSGTYYIWSRNRTSVNTRNSYYLQVDDNCGVVVGDRNLPVNSWTWVNYQDGSSENKMRVQLSSGTHRINLYGIDQSVQVDRILLTQEASCSPTGTGDNCITENTPTPVPTPTPETPQTPIVTSTTPKNKKVSGRIQAGSDNPATKTTILVDGRVVTSAYGMAELDTSKLTNGVHTITVKKVNPDGSVEIVSKQIVVNNDLSVWSHLHNLLLRTVHYNQKITNAIIFVGSGALFAGFAFMVYRFWERRVWERLPIIRRIHLSFLHWPNRFKTLFKPKMVSQKTLSNGTVVYGTLDSGTRLDRLRLHFKNHEFVINLPLTLIIMAFSLVGAATVLNSVAATSARTVDPESGSRIGVATRSDSSAAGGAYIQFGTGVAATCPAGQTGTPPNCTTPPKQFTSKCLQRSGTEIRLTGARESAYTNKTLKPNTIINAKGLTWDGRDSNGVPIPWVTTFGGEGPACWFGGKYQGVWNDADPNITWEDPYHHAGIATIRNPDFLMEGIRADNNGDGIRVEIPGDDFHVRGVWVSNMHDDCFENDHMQGGIVEDSFFDGCYAGISMDHRSPALDGSHNTVTIKDNLLWMKPMNTVFRGTAPGTAMLFKGWGVNRAIAPKIVLENNIYRIDQKAGFEQHKLPPLMDLRTCTNQTIVWTGAGEFPYKQFFPSCFKITKDISVWNNAVKKWKDEHANIF